MTEPDTKPLRGLKTWERLNTKIYNHYRELVASYMWRIGAVEINLTEPFKLASGNHSPIYMNCRKLISSPEFRSVFAAAAQTIRRGHGLRFDAVAGGETAGIPFAAFLAQTFDLPMLYVRKTSKTHGLAGNVEGMSDELSTRANVLLVEDLITDAGSKLAFIESLDNVGFTITDTLVVCDRQQGGGEALREEGIELHSMTNICHVIDTGDEAGFLNTSESLEVRSYLLHPESWHGERDLPYNTP